MDTPSILTRDEESRKVSENHDWSKLCSDVLRKIFERLSSIDIYLAKIVCSDWYSVWKICVNGPLCPWQIIYKDGSYMLLKPGEDKAYTTQILGLSDNSYYMASSGSWLLMVDSRLDFYIFNLLTCKRINLPSLECPIRGAQVRFERSSESRYVVWGQFVEPCRTDYVSENIFGCKRSAVLWMNERTGDYVVAWICNMHYLFTYKKGDDSWWNWNSNWKSTGKNLGYLDLAYKNSKLYLYTSKNRIKIIDFSGDFPKEEIAKNPYRGHPFHYIPQRELIILKRRIAIQKSGEVVIVLSLLSTILNDEKKTFFYIFKMNLESGKWERVDSIGDDEMLIFGYGVTIRAPVRDLGDGIKSDSICFVEDEVPPTYHCDSYCGIFDLATSSIKWPKHFGVTITKSQWFVPGFS